MRRSVLFLSLFVLGGCAATQQTTTTTPSGETTTTGAAANQLTAIAAPATPKPPLIRVGLISDEAEATFARRENGYSLITDSGAFSTRRGFTLRAPLAGATVRYGVQVGAISDQTSANTFAAKVQSETRQQPVQVFDAREGLYRIIVGDFETREAAQPFREEMLKSGLATPPLIVPRPSAQQFTRVITFVDDEGFRRDFSGESLLVLANQSETIQIAGSPYRGAARVFINNRGLLNLINELNLEDYTRGVVPNEMGPRVFDEFEAQKVQALAARTYAVKRLGEYRTEGYDICPTPACQVYKGFSTEEAVSNRAIDETAGLVIAYQGEAIDALFTSTCGGMTSDVATMFPGRNEPYLRSATCVEDDVRFMDGRRDGPLMTDQQFEARLFETITGLGTTKSWSGRDVAAAVTAAARYAGVSLPVTQPFTKARSLAPPASSRRGDVLRYLATALAAEAHAETLILPEDEKYFFPRRHTADEASAAAFLIKYRIVPAQYLEGLDMNAAMPRDELYALLASWLRKRELVSEVTARISAVEGRDVVLRIDGKPTRFSLPADAPIYRRVVDRIQEHDSVPYKLGDRATIVRRGTGDPLALIVIANYDGAAFDRYSSYSSWVRTYRAPDLITTISRRNPIRELHDLRPRTIDNAKRYAEFDVVAEGGRVVTLRGLPIRWSFGIPDNIFTYEKSKDPDGVDRYTFYGKGWGHGTGMCQTGSQGMAIEGFTAEQIVKHYYKGVEIVPIQQLSATR